ncbi:uncharacterized protein N7482_000634 [Penicillium canariense]|uniref:Uncharacterized protein n=1 Tax=Penicillium canariense TaxID=189055 RepID=A0A9W9IE51_9EURO|nr:uncharacterized protein N7482_000634 [Penicillium canariense]KAJ5174757.1 hypothetical protein N7482_000634 [Penicillium canariense]
MHSPHLPTEVLICIAEWLSCDPPYDPTLNPFGWYSVGISYLYSFPQLWEGNRFVQFTNTVSPPLGLPKSKVDLGTMVKVLHLGGLVHQSSNSQTARLLGRLKKGLTKFVAPQTGLAQVVNGLAAISKCRELRHLDLRLVRGRSIDFPRIKKAVSNLQQLRSLFLPATMEMTPTDSSAGEWPPRLSYMTVGGYFNPELMPTFNWPPNISKLQLRYCTELDTPVLKNIFSNEQLRTSLKGLILNNTNWEMFSEEESDVLYSLPNLDYLKMPLDFMKYLMILPVRHERQPLPLRTLELTQRYFRDDLNFNFSEELLKALSNNLRNLWALGIGESSLDDIKDSYKRIDDEIWKHVETSSDDEFDKLGIEDVGIYTIDDDTGCGDRTLVAPVNDFNI